MEREAGVDVEDEDLWEGGEYNEEEEEEARERAETVE